MPFRAPYLKANKGEDRLLPSSRRAPHFRTRAAKIRASTTDIDLALTTNTTIGPTPRLPADPAPLRPRLPTPMGGDG